MGPSVLFYGSYPPPFGGISSHLSGFVPFLAERGFTCDVVSPGRDTTLEQHDGFRVQRMPKTRSDAAAVLGRRPGRLLADVLRARRLDSDVMEASYIAGMGERLIRSRGRVPDLVSAYHVYPWGLAAYLTHLRYGVPYVLTNFGEFYAQPDRYRRSSELVRRIADSAAQLLASSRHCACGYRVVDIDRTVRVIPLGVDMEHFADRGQGREAREALGASPDDTVVLFVGRFIRDMGLDTYIDAARSLLRTGPAALRFWMVGAKGDLLTQAEALRAEFPDRVHIENDVPFDRLPTLYAASDIVAVPTADERGCMGLAMKEGMAVGRAVIGADVGGIPEAISDGDNGLLFPPGDSAALARAVLRLHENAADRVSMGLAGLDTARRRFSMSGTLTETLEVFHQAMGSEGP